MQAVGPLADDRHKFAICGEHAPLRPGNAGSNIAADHVEVTRLALAQLPAARRRQVLIWADSAGGTRDFLAWLARPERRLAYSAGMTITADIEDAYPRPAEESLDSRLRRRAQSVEFEQ